MLSLSCLNHRDSHQVLCYKVAASCTTGSDREWMLGSPLAGSYYAENITSPQSNGSISRQEVSATLTTTLTNYSTTFDKQSWHSYSCKDIAASQGKASGMTVTSKVIICTTIAKRCITAADAIIALQLETRIRGGANSYQRVSLASLKF